MEQWITDVYYIAMGIYRIPEHFGIRFKDEGMIVRNVLTRKESLYVEHPAEEEVYKRLDDRFVVLRGPKGDGLSMVAFAALTRKILHDHAVVVDAIAARDCLNDVTSLLKVVDSIRDVGREPIFYLDLSRPGYYPQKPWEGVGYSPAEFKKFVDALENIEYVSRNKSVTTIAVISDDLYGILKRLKEHVAVEVNSNDTRFLGELAQVYSGCGEDVAAEIAKTIVAKHDCGRAVLATLAADWLARRSCRGTVAEALQAAEDKAVELFIDYIWHTVLNGDRPYANLHAPLFLLRHFEGPVPAESAKEFLISLEFEKYKIRNSMAVKWLAMHHCNLIESAIRKAVETALTKRIDKQPYSALRSAAVDYHKHFKARGYFK